MINRERDINKQLDVLTTMHGVGVSTYLIITKQQC